MYVGSAILSYILQYIMAGVSQRTVYDMSKQVNDKLARLPLKFFDGRTHGEIMSRFTNDMDNIANTLQQSLTQLITSAVTHHRGDRHDAHHQPAAHPHHDRRAAPELPHDAVIAPKSQKYFADQWKNIGELNGHIEEMYTGHTIVKAFGHERKAIEKFNDVNEKVYDASWRAQFISGLLFPLMTFINNIGYVAVAVAGGIMVTRKAIAIGDIQAFIQYSRSSPCPSRRRRTSPTSCRAPSPPPSASSSSSTSRRSSRMPRTPSCSQARGARCASRTWTSATSRMRPSSRT